MGEAPRTSPSPKPLCALEFRYGDPEIQAAFSEEGKLARLLEVEAALARAHARVSNVPDEAAAEIEAKADLEHVTPERVKEIEAEIKHDLMAVVEALSEACEGDAGSYVHLGATSYDIIDTANALMMREGLDLIDEQLERLEEALAELAREHRATACPGRTHGQHAVPTTFGYKMATYLQEVHRHRQRLQQAREEELVGKMMGAVGTGAGFGEDAFAIEEAVGDILDLEMETAPTQIVGRDRYNEVFAELVNVVTSLEKFATEIRNLQRNEIGEAAEGFEEESQVGSSTMAQKRNPISSEKVCGLARTARAFLDPAYENAVQWHERDLANSSSERFILPHLFTLTHEALSVSATVFRDLQVDPERMCENLELTPTITAERIVVGLAERGVPRQEAHEHVRQASLEAEDRESFQQALLDREEVRSAVKPGELAGWLDPTNYLGKAPELVDRVLADTGYDE
jgi:adenylosuccinate lyase